MSMTTGEARHTDHPLRELVACDARGRATEEEAAHLRKPEVLEHWTDALHELLTDISAQFQERKAALKRKRIECLARGEAGRQEWYEYSANNEKWKAGALRFKAGLEKSMREAKRLEHEHKQRAVAEERESLHEVLEDVRVRIERIEKKLEERA